MDSTNTTAKLLFSVECPFLNRTVVLKRKTWYVHIIPNHPEVSNRLPLIKDILAGKQDDIRLFKDRRDSNKVVIYHECPHLMPSNCLIKIAVNLVDDSNAAVAVVTTVYGLNDFPGKDMEEIT